jgi:CTP synthase (UTP-ammonia lyase)
MGWYHCLRTTDSSGTRGQKAGAEEETWEKIKTETKPTWIGTQGHPEAQILRAPSLLFHHILQAMIQAPPL